MSKEPGNQPKPQLTQEQLRALDPEYWTDERIDQQMGQWSYRLPTDPDEYLAHARNASAYEHVMRGLNFDRHEGIISEEDYQRLAQETNEKHFGDGD